MSLRLAEPYQSVLLTLESHFHPQLQCQGLPVAPSLGLTLVTSTFLPMTGHSESTMILLQYHLSPIGVASDNGVGYLWLNGENPDPNIALFLASSVTSVSSSVKWI